MDEHREVTVTPDRVRDLPLRGRFGRLQPDPPRRRVRAVGRPARPDPARPVDDGPGRARVQSRRPAGAEVAVASSSAGWACRRRRSRSPRLKSGADGEVGWPARPSRTGTSSSGADARFLESERVLTPRQALLLGKVVDGFSQTGQPVGLQDARRRPRGRPPGRRRSATSSPCSRSTACSRTRTRRAGRVPTDAGYRYYVDALLPAAPPAPELRLRSCAARSTRRCG